MKNSIDIMHEFCEYLTDELNKANAEKKRAEEEYFKLAQTFKGFTGKYGTYEELSKKYEDLWKDYQSLLKLLDTTNGRLAYQNMMLDKAREAYKYITAEDRDKQI